MKRGREDATTIFGDDSEYYVGGLLKMQKNPNGSLRPDLVSVNGIYRPRLSLEVKSGEEGKVSLVSYQLHYSINSPAAFERIFGESPPEDNGLFPRGEEFDSAYYYGVIARQKGLRSEDVRERYNSIKLEWGNLYIVPHQIAFHSFANARHLRTGEDLDVIEKDLRELMRANFLDQRSNYRTQKNRQDWQNMYARDLHAIFMQDPGLATASGQDRISLLKERYKGLNLLKRVRIKGPGDTYIYVLSEPRHRGLFNNQMRKVVEERTPIIEAVWRERRRALPLLERMISTSVQNYAFDFIGAQEVLTVAQSEPLQPEDYRLLHRLSRWQGRYDDFSSDPERDEREAIAAEQDELGEIPSDEEEAVPF